MPQILYSNLPIPKSFIQPILSIWYCLLYGRQIKVRWKIQLNLLLYIISLNSMNKPEHVQTSKLRAKTDYSQSIFKKQYAQNGHIFINQKIQRENPIFYNIFFSNFPYQVHQVQLQTQNQDLLQPLFLCLIHPMRSWFVLSFS